MDIPAKNVIITFMTAICAGPAAVTVSPDYLYVKDGAFCKKAKRARIYSIDFLRGVCILFMVFDHTLLLTDYLFDGLWVDGFLGKVYDFAAGWYKDPFRVEFRILVPISFFILSGLSASFSRDHFADGLKLVLVALVINIATRAMADMFDDEALMVEFGIFSCFAAVKIIYAFLDAARGASPLDKENSPLKKNLNELFFCIILLTAAIIFIWLEKVTSEVSGVYAKNHNLLIFGVEPEDYYYLDYFPLFPYAGYFLLGAVLGRIFYKYTIPPRVYPVRPEEKITMAASAPVRFLGRNTIFVYLLHIPVMAVFLSLVSLIGGCVLPV